MINTKIGLAAKFILAISAVIALTSVILSWFFINHQTTQMENALEDEGKYLVRNLASYSEYGVLTANRELLLKFVKGLMKEEGVVYGLIEDQAGEILAFAGSVEPEELVQKTKRDITEGLRTASREPLVQLYHSKEKESIYDFTIPIITQRIERRREEIGLIEAEEKPTVIKERIGTARVGLSSARMNRMIGQVKNTAALLASVVIIIGILVAYLLVGLIVKPVRQLVLGTQRIAGGDLAAKVVVKSMDEIGELADSFNQMTEELRVSRDDVDRYSRKLEQMVEKRTKLLKEAQAQLVQSAKMAAVGELGAGVAHELNNPLGGILGYTQFILDKFKRPGFGIDDLKACQRYIESIERESTRCKGIVNNLLTFSRRPMSAKPEPIDIGRAIKETLSITGHQLKLKNIQVTTEIKLDLYKVTGITNQLQQVFTNIIINAQQAMPEGGKLKISAINSQDEKTKTKKVKIEFADTGCGIPKDILPRIFEPFFTTKQKQKGTGLGLSVSYQIIHTLKGNISVESRGGKETTFIITLPAVM